jgi:anti-anti-sigma regulatory factor
VRALLIATFSVSFWKARLDARWAAELKSACEEARADLRGREIVIEMKHITRISQEGEDVMLGLIKSGVRFRGSGVFAKHVVKELTRRARSDLGRRKR